MRPIHLASLLLLGACSETPKGVGTINGNVAPTLGGVSLQPEPAYEGTLLNCTAAGVSDADGDSVILTYAWTVAGTEIAATSQTLNGNDFGKGDVVSCTVTPSDGTQTGGSATSNLVTIQNTPPRANGVEIDPDPATVLDALLAVPLGFTDDDGDDEYWRYQWFINGVGAGTNDTLTTGYAKGDEVFVVVTPDDGDDQGDPIQSDTLIIANSPPTFTGAQITPVGPTANDLLVCAPTGGSDADGDPVNPLYQWYVNGAPAGSGTELLAAPQFQRGDAVYCVITPNDGEDDGPPVQSPQVNILNSVPSIASVGLTPDPAYESSVLTCAPAGLVDGDGDVISLQFTWTVNGLPIVASTSTLTGASFSKNQAVQCSVTPNDGFTAGATVASNVIVISNSPPTGAGVTVTPANPDTTTTVSASPTGFADADGDPANWQFQWYVNGIAQVGQVSSTLAGTYFIRGDSVSVEALPYDGQITGGSVVSSPVIVVNSPPGPPQVQITPALPEPTDNLVCNVTLASVDADSDPVTYDYSWKRNGVDTGNTTNTVNAASTAFGDSWICEVTPDDGIDFGNPGSAVVSITDVSPPGAPNLDPINSIRNSGAITCTGDAEPLSTIDIYVSCDMGSSGTAQTAAAPNGDVSFPWNILPGEYCEFYITSTDGVGNVSPPSNTIFTTVCPISDPWEDGSYGNDSFTPIDEWAPLPDNGVGAVNITATILPGDPGDWYVIHTTDGAPVGSQSKYNVAMDLTSGIGTYTFQVYRSDVGAGDIECSGLNQGYDEYNDYFNGLISGTYCAVGAGTLGYDDCGDLGNDYYIRVIRNGAVAASCDPYTITITNGATVTPI